MADGINTNLHELREVANFQVDALFDVIALLKSSLASTQPGEPLDEDGVVNLRRVVRVAEDRVGDVIQAFTPYI